MRKRLAWLLLAAVLPLGLLLVGMAERSSAQSGVRGATTIVIDAVLYDGYELNDADEAVRLRNVSNAAIGVGQWQLSDGTSTAVLPTGATLGAGQSAWLAKDSASFSRQFGFLPDYEVTDSNAGVPDLSGTWPGYANAGDEVILRNNGGAIIDCLIYKSGDSGVCGQWSGAAVAPYRVTGVFGEEGQILYRRRDQATAMPVPDTNTVADWAQTTADVIDGRRVMYPGWDPDTFFFTAGAMETARLTVAIAPDNAYQALVDEINSATTSIQIETLTFENVAIGAALVAAAHRGVAVTVLLEGGPPGGMNHHQRYVCGQLEAAGGQCWFMISDSSARVFDRYRFLHAKFTLIDGQRVAISSENLSPNSLPDDDKSDGTWGRRGVVLITDAAAVVAHLQAIFDHDFDPANHVDLFRWQADHPTYGAPPTGFTPILETGGVTYTVRFAAPTTFTGLFAFEVIQSPENSLRDRDGLLGLVNRAGAGDTVLVQQLVERPYWGATSSNPIDDPNPRLEAYIAAARRGAAVRLLLDEHFDDSGSPVSNAATCAYVKAIAAAEGLPLNCALANPTGLGIHNKMVLAQIDGQGTIHVGSLNGTEQSNKGNRELALQVQSDEAFALLAEMFERDWPRQIYLPLAFNNFTGPAQHVLISEVLYDAPGPDDAEFIELVNPTRATIDISHYTLGDAVNRTDFEDVRRFPAGTTLAPAATLVVATTATAFRAEYGFDPDFEIVGTDAAVPDLIDDPGWGDPQALLQLANGGDEVILRNAAEQAVDVVTYGSGNFPGVVACALVLTSGHSLERFPYWRDTNNCPADFRDWPFPNPGSLP